MSLAVAGLLPDQLGHLKGMQDTYDMVKARSPSIGPNVSLVSRFLIYFQLTISLVFQLVEYGRNLTALLTAHPKPVETSFPRTNDIETEAEWAARRREFDEQDVDSEYAISPLLRNPTIGSGFLDPREEADRLDEAMKTRKKTKAVLTPIVTNA